MKTLAAALSLAALLPLAGCTSSPGAWAYYDRNYDSGQEGYARPVNNSGSYYGEAVYGRPYGTALSTPQPQYFDWSYEAPVYAGEPHHAPRPSRRCNCIQPSSHQGSKQAPAQDPSWNSTYYAIGP